MGSTQSSPRQEGPDQGAAAPTAVEVGDGRPRGEAIPLVPTGASAVPLALPSGGLSGPSTPAVAASYFGETSRMLFGPHFIVNAPHLTADLGDIPPSVTSRGESIVGNDVSTVGTDAALLMEQGSARIGSDARSSSLGRDPIVQIGIPGVSVGRKITEAQLKRIRELYNETPPQEIKATTTFQSLTNLKKNTLRLVPVVPLPSVAPDGSSVSSVGTDPYAVKHRLEFQFDSSTSCIIRIHWVAREIIFESASGIRKLAFIGRRKREPIVLGPFPAGLCQSVKLPDSMLLSLDEYDHADLSLPDGAGAETSDAETKDDVQVVAASAGDGHNGNLSVPAPGGAEEKSSSTVLNVQDGAGVETATNLRAGNSSLDPAPVSLRPKKSMMNVEPTTILGSLLGKRNMVVFYPLVVQLEALSDEREIQLSEPNVASVNTQVTYANLSISKESQRVEIKVIAQKVMIGDTIFTLRDIFGFTDATGTGAAEPTTPANAEEAEDLQTMRECVICMSEPKDTIVLPCRHLCLCRNCAEVLRFQGRSRGPSNRPVGGNNGAPKCPICRQVFQSLLQINLPKPFALAEANSNNPTTSESVHPQTSISVE